MARSPWSCPVCGTENAVGARACAGCGRWPSVFDLERSEPRYRSDTLPAADASPSTEVEALPVDVEVFTGGAGDVRPAPEEGSEEKSFRWGPVLTFLLAAAFVLFSWLSSALGD
jgi:hypothetical protein